ncbi:MAG: N-acetylmuramoyl-L-alanine amidase [Candidatus Peregrinibacteria bacterium]
MRYAHGFFAIAALTLLLAADSLAVRTFSFTDPIDGLSIGMTAEGAPFRVRSGQTPWQELPPSEENALETAFVLFAKPVKSVAVQSPTRTFTLHPLRISSEPSHYAIAAATPFVPSRIVTRSQWGADASLLYNHAATEEDPTPINVGEDGNIADRMKECDDARKKYPDEFKVENTATQSPDGQTYRWPLSYSPRIRLLVVHHTAIRVLGDDRPSVERMRALYQYHGSSLGWGDIGYHFVIDEAGKIYEGRTGGDRVIGGHVFCGNVGTIGIALMGNFELEDPPQDQIKSLKWLLDFLAKKYQINLREKVSFHGTLLQTITGHGDIGHTACPGYTLREMLPQIRTHVLAGKLGAAIAYPPKRVYNDRTSERKAARLPKEKPFTAPVMRPVGSTDITVRPGGQALFSLSLTAGSALIPRRARIAVVERSSPRIGLWETFGDEDIRVQKELLSPSSVKSGETAVIHLRVLVPRQTRSYQLIIGNITFNLLAEGRRIPLPRTGSGAMQSSMNESLFIPTPRNPNGTTEQSSSAAPVSLSIRNAIRIRLSYEGESATVTSDNFPSVNGKTIALHSIEFTKGDDACTASFGGLNISAPAVRFDPLAESSAILSWPRTQNRFRGIIECRVIEGKLTLINELSLEDYLAGLAEEPDSEPFEKQRAFAVAARTYAAYYLHPLHRKFPGLPYDGDDSPARFQSYRGLVFERQNPAWVRAVRGTKELVLKKDSEIIKPPYFSSDDGRTRSPEEVGWNHFPFEEIYGSKPDPWCEGLPLNGHGVGMSGCGAKGQALEGKKAEAILKYYYPGTTIEDLGRG